MSVSLTEVAHALIERFAAQQKNFRDQTILIIAPEHITAAAQALRDEFGFAMLSDLTAVDYWPEGAPRFHVIYQIRDVQNNHLITLRVPVDGARPVLPTLEKIYPNANWHERELWDMFGLKFEGHSDLRRIIMPYDWEGHPLRKDYPLGYEEVEFSFNLNQVEMRKPRPRD